MLRKLKLAAVSLASRTGLTQLVGDSAWRRNRLLILCYHGISLRDEHVWAPDLYIQQALLRRRMERLRKLKCNVLPLAEAIERLYSNDLPEKSVAVTFDDGWHDFYGRAFPVLGELGIPATVYLTSYYSNFNRPVFDAMVRYMLWKAAGRQFALSPIVPAPVLLRGSGANQVIDAINNYVRRQQLTGQKKDELQLDVAEHLGINFQELLRQKVLHLMTPGEVTEVARGGIDVQLHTHRHRVSSRLDLFNREIEDNRAQIQLMTGTPPQHFCYPGGNYLPQFEGWLSALGVVSATTCVAGMCTNRTNRFFLPRLLDGGSVQDCEFESWLTGLAEFLPKRHYPPAGGQFLEDWDQDISK